MKKSSMPWSTKQFKKMYDNNHISFTIPFQRPKNQWDSRTKSLWIHTLAAGYIAPYILSYKKEDTYFVFDGQQRLTTTFDFINNLFPLHMATAKVKDDDTGKSYNVAGSFFKDLPEDVQDNILSYMLNMVRVEGTKEEIKEMMIRCNSGKPLTKQQLAKASASDDWEELLNEMTDHPFIAEKCSLSKAQLKNSDDEVILIQTMMLLDKNYELVSLTSAKAAEYTKVLDENSDEKKLIADNILIALDYLHKAIAEEGQLLTKKVHLPMLIIVAIQAVGKNIEPSVFNDWVEMFQIDITNSENTKYNQYRGQGSVKKDMAIGRLTEMNNHFNKYISQIQQSKESVTK